MGGNKKVECELRREALVGGRRLAVGGGRVWRVERWLEMKSTEERSNSRSETMKMKN